MVCDVGEVYHSRAEDDFANIHDCVERALLGLAKANQKLDVPDNVKNRANVFVEFMRILGKVQYLHSNSDESSTLTSGVDNFSTRPSAPTPSHRKYQRNSASNSSTPASVKEQYLATQVLILHLPSLLIRFLPLLPISHLPSTLR